MSSYNDDRAVAYWQGLGWTERDEPTAPAAPSDGCRRAESGPGGAS
jgi:hypothetical protein